jgi:2-phospho-L-lactate guanylyltransferase (CobY/MobA/RfbA family)
MGFRFHYGEGSFARHFAEAEKLGLAIETVRSAGLALDIDTPKDLADSQNITGHLAARTSSTRSAIIWSSAGRRAARLLSGSGERLWSEAIAGAE